MTAHTVEGLLLIDKPAGPTSHDIVQRARRALGQRRVGHTGTLDPAATGLLPLVVGRATRLARFLPQEPKVYTGTLRLGAVSTTDDAEGELSPGPAPPPDDGAAVTEAAGRLLGEIDQVPPDFSAKKVGGRRLHQLARRGETVEARPCRVTVHRFELQATDDPARWSFVAEVSSGTYIRALARDLGRGLGCGGLLESLRRTTIGTLSVERAVAWSAQGEPPERERLVAATIPLDDLPLALEDLRLDDTAGARFRLGGVVDGPPGTESGRYRVTGAGGGLLGIGEIRDGRVHPRVVIATSEAGIPASER